MHLKVKVFPDSKEESIHKEDYDKFKIYVRETATQGRVNKRLQRILENLYSDSSVRLVSGHKSQNKIFAINH